MLVDAADRATVALFPAQKGYRRMGSRPSQYFRATDAENACADWQAAAGKELKCEKVRENSAPDRSIEYVWIDPKINKLCGQVGHG
jgi:hypothetical protein